jgi:tetratricopeptide (TPR) repeat protein
MDLVPTRPRKTMVITAFVFLVLLGTAGLCLREWPYWQAAREARLQLAGGRYREAARTANRWLRSRPEAAEAHFVRAKAAIALGSRTEIVEGMRKAKALGYPEERIALLRALLDAQAGRFALARPVLLRAFNAMREPDPMLEEALARVLMETYDWPNAVKVLARWTTDAPDDARPPLWHATVKLRQGAELKDVINDYREALRRDPKLPEALIGLADELSKAFKNDEAARYYDTYLELKPDDAAGHLGAGRNALGLGDLAAAARRIDCALELDPSDAVAHYERARVDLMQGDLNAALKHLDKSIELRPYDSPVRYSRKITLIRLGRLAAAAEDQRAIDRLKADLDRMQDLQARLAQSPNDLVLQYQLALWMFTHGYGPEGVKWSQKILTDHPGHRETCALLADYFDRQGDVVSASRYRAQSR